MYHRPMYHTLVKRVREPRRFIQVLAGPRQAGKTTMVRQIADETRVPVHYASADEPTLQSRAWIEQQWETGRSLAAESAGKGGALLVLDEIQKVTGWSGVVKKLWDSDTRKKISLKVVLLGSAPLLIQRGLTESLAGRFETIPVLHWSYAEMREAFGWDLDRFIYFGGYPGAADLIADRHRWSRYIIDSLIETTISRDILLLTRVDKPALISAQSPLTFEAARKDRESWGRLVESAVGAHLINSAAGTGVEVFYWRERSREVDFVLQSGKTVVAIEVKSGSHKEGLPGMDAFDKTFQPQRKLLAGGDGIPLEKFMLTPAADWVA